MINDRGDELGDGQGDSMRVIAGLYRGRRLRTIPGLDTRPTADRLRETLFNVLSPRIQGAYFLDVCAGSGAVGIEALSRGASHVVFVEQSRVACGIIKENLAPLGAEKKTEIVNRDASVAINALAVRSQKFDIIYFDPPYDSNLYSEAIPLIEGGGLLNDDAILVVEHRAKAPLEPCYGSLQLYREIKQGDSSIAFYRVELGEPPTAQDDEARPA